MAKSENTPVFTGYSKNDLYDEIYRKSTDVVPDYQMIFDQFNEYKINDYKKLNDQAKVSFINQGITFTVYSDNNDGIERIFPFDLFPRVITKQDWLRLEHGLIQRSEAINCFLWDLYHHKKILKDKVIPYDLIFSSQYYNMEMMDINPRGKIYTHISGTDLIRHKDGEYYVLEDNVRSPSGVSYVLSNRVAMKRSLSNLFFQYNIATVEDYPQQLLAVLKSVAPKGVDDPTCAVLTPGVYNSAYFEHTFLARNMGVELVEGRDLFVEKNFVYMKTIFGPKKLDVLYRRVDDDFIDPFVYNPSSVLGVPGLMEAYRKGNITLINAPGTGIADDKAVYIYMPEIIKYYLNQDPILNNVPTYRCNKNEDLQYVIDHMEQLVLKPVDESGGYGLLIGSIATKNEISEYKDRIKHNPRKYIAQPIMSLSVHPTYIEEREQFEPRHIDLRTFTLFGKEKIHVLKGGLTRVALREGSLIVNSSQGGGSKDTWVLDV